MLERFIRPPIRPDQLQEPRWARFLFAGTTAAWFWLVVRLYEADFVLAGALGANPALIILGTLLTLAWRCGLDRSRSMVLPWVHQRLYERDRAPAT